MGGGGAFSRTLMEMPSSFEVNASTVLVCSLIKLLKFSSFFMAICSMAFAKVPSKSTLDPPSPTLRVHKHVLPFLWGVGFFIHCVLF